MASISSSEQRDVHVAVDLRILDRPGMERSGIGRYALENLAAMRAARPRWRWSIHSGRRDLVAPGPGAEVVATRWPTGSALGRIAWLTLAAGAGRPAADVWFSPASVLPARWRGPSVITIHDLVFALRRDLYRGRLNGLYATAAIGRSARRATRIVCPSATTAERAAERFRLDRARMTVSRWGVSAALSGPEPGPQPGETEEPYLLFVGRWEARKGLDVLAEALRLIGARGRRPRLKLAGGPGWGADRAVEELLGAPGGEAVPDPSDAELAALYDGASALVYPSRMEGFGLPVAEAMARGCPVIASDLPELREWAGEAPAYVPPGDAGALAEAIAALAADPAVRARMAATGREVAARMGWDRAAEATASAIEAALAA